MAESEVERPVAELERPVSGAPEGAAAYRGVAVVVAVVAAYIAGWRSRRRWGRFLGW